MSCCRPVQAATTSVQLRRACAHRAVANNCRMFAQKCADDAMRSTTLASTSVRAFDSAMRSARRNRPRSLKQLSDPLRPATPSPRATRREGNDERDAERTCECAQTRARFRRAPAFIALTNSASSAASDKDRRWRKKRDMERRCELECSRREIAASATPRRARERRSANQSVRRIRAQSSRASLSPESAYRHLRSRVRAGPCPA